MGPLGILLPLLKHYIKCKSPLKRCWDQVSPKAGVKQGKVGSKDPLSAFLCINLLCVMLMDMEIYVNGNRIIESCKLGGKKNTDSAILQFSCYYSNPG